MPRKVIMTAGDVRRTLARIAHEIIERNRSVERLVLVGMYTRGVPLARRLAARVRDFGGQGVPVGALDISRHRDDRPFRNSPSGPGGSASDRLTEVPVSIEGRTVVLVDDVLYTGRSIRAAMDALVELGRPQSIQLAVLVDRGHRELPIRADYVGKNVPSSRDEEIRVSLEETDGVDEVTIVGRVISGVSLRAD